MSSYTENSSQAPEMQQNLELLQEHQFFSSFPIQALKVLALVAQRLTFGEGETIFETGDDHGHAYLVLHGELLLIKNDTDQEEIHTYGGGDLIGILRLFQPLPSLFTLEVQKETYALSITREQISKILEQFPETAAIALKALAKEVHHWERKILTRSERCCLKQAGISNL